MAFHEVALATHSSRRPTLGDPNVNDGAQTGKPLWSRFRLDRDAVRVVCAGGLAVILLVLYHFPYGDIGVVEWWLRPVQRLYAHLTGFVLGLFEPHVEVLDTTVCGRCRLMVVKGCDGIEAGILFGAAMIALRGAWSRKAFALLAGLEALMAFNVLRLCCLYYISANFKQLFESAHSEVFPVVAVVFAMVDFMICARWLRRSENRARGELAGGGAPP